MGKRPQPAASGTPQTKTLKIQQVRDEPIEQTQAKFVTRPEVGAATTASGYNGLTADVDINFLVSEMSAQTGKANDGDLSRAEAMLLSQAHALDAIFNEMAQRAARNMGTYLDATETYMRMALKAQGQCRATLQTLGELKMPKSIAFIKQANVANGPQQVNNGAGAGSHAQQAKSTNKLLEASDGEWMDTRAPSPTGAVDSAMAAVGELDRPTNGRG
jgi:hypothetical protein